MARRVKSGRGTFVPKSKAAKWAEYADHPRYGRSPRFTGLDPDPNDPGVHLHWNTRILPEPLRRYRKLLMGQTGAWPEEGDRVIPGTAVPADMARQTPSTVPVSHYYDLDLVCCGCRRRFIFFALEQKHWYEDLHFPLDAQAVRCVACRRRMQDVGRLRRRYEQVVARTQRGPAETLEMIGCLLGLMEEGVFSRRQTEQVRRWLKRLPEAEQGGDLVESLRARLRALEQADGAG